MAASWPTAPSGVRGNPVGRAVAGSAGAGIGRGAAVSTATTGCGWDAAGAAVAIGRAASSSSASAASWTLAPGIAGAAVTVRAVAVLDGVPVPGLVGLPGSGGPVCAARDQRKMTRPQARDAPRTNRPVRLSQPCERDVRGDRPARSDRVRVEVISYAAPKPERKA